MRVSAKADYAVRAGVELAAADPASVSRERLAQAQQIPAAFLENILLELKHAGIVKSYRGAVGGYGLARPAADITIADIVRAVEGPMASVRGERIETLAYSGPAERLRDVWVAVRASLRDILENISLADVVAGNLPEHVVALTNSPEAWISAGRVHRRRQPATSSARPGGSTADGQSGGSAAPAMPTAPARPTAPAMNLAAAPDRRRRA